MPLYEGVGLVGDKHAVVFDVGTAYTKCGFATEFSPRATIPSVLTEWSLCGDQPAQTVNIVDFSRPVEEQFKIFAQFFHNLYFKYLLANPKERRVVIVESILTPTNYRNVMARVFFDYFEVPSVVFAPSHLMACFPLGTQSGLIVDVGYNESLVLPIFEGVPMLNCWEASPVGGRSMHRAIETYLKENCKVRTTAGELSISECPEVINENVVEDLKVRSCFVTHMERGKAIQAAANDPSLRGKVSKAPLGFEYQLDGDKVLFVKGELREASAECMFQNDIDDKSIPQLILDSLLRCPIDLRKPLAEHILVIGGGCMLPGFMARLKAELLDLLQDQTKQYASKLPLKTVKFFKAPSKENFTAWLGGSVFGALEILPHRSVSREEYQQKPHIPDWTSFDSSLTFPTDI